MAHAQTPTRLHAPQARPPADAAPQPLADAPHAQPGEVIDLRAPEAVRRWSQRLGCSEAQLRLAVAAVGAEVAEVCNHLGMPLPAAGARLPH